jgi:mRNA interferase MazF
MRHGKTWRGATSLTIRRGDVWLVNFDPTKGAEMTKTRPAVVVSSDAIGILPIKMIAPATDWKDRYSRNLWHIRIDPDKTNGLSKISAVDALQVRGVATERFIRKLGKVSVSTMDEIVAAIAAVIEYE